MLHMLFTSPVFYMTAIGMVIQFIIAGYLIRFFVKQSRKERGDK